MDDRQPEPRPGARCPQEGRSSCLAPFRKTLLAEAVLALLTLLGACTATADIYQYKDQRGNWVITDSPPPGDAKIVRTIRDPKGRSPSPSGFSDIEGDLLGKFRPRGAVEIASLSTVTVQTSIGVGSGFFINEKGYILTNRHVLRGDEAQLKETEKAIAQTDSRLEDDEAAITNAENQLRAIRSRLDAYRASIDGMPDPEARAMAMQRYQSQAAQYDLHEAQLRKRKGEFEEQKGKYLKQKEDFTERNRRAQYDRTFVVILKDRTEHQASLVALSRDHDLALLRIEGCKSPYIRPGAPGEVVQGMRVYAIGCPLGLGDSVSAGIISGYDRDYIRTDAKIYPGNSGGPLITAGGKVVGINTLKLITRKFEGMGFAIPIRRALQEFQQELDPVPQ